MMLRYQAKSTTALLRAFLAAAAVMTLSGCLAIDGASIQSQPVAEVATASGPAAATPFPTGPNITGRYPTFGGPLTAANVQMENTDATRIEARMNALAAARQSGAVTEAEYQRRLAELRLLANDHGPAAEAAISN